ncbi:MAG TPA: hypothetical protein VFS36_06400 [Chitinophagaceae bacterium]|nr:hypothetical protein [Chitinophagaceae bacterium]
MKNLFLFLAIIVSLAAQSQSTTKVQTDSLRIFQVGGLPAELIIENGTRSNTNAFLQNWNNGRTRFAYAIDSVWQDTSGIHFRRGNSTQSFTFPSSITYTGSGGVNVNSATKEISAPGKVDSSRMRNDSLFYYKGGVEYYGGKTTANTPVWGTLIGTLSDQSDLQAALDAKQNLLPSGTSAQYWAANGSLRNFDSAVKATGDPRYAPLVHTHTGSQIINLTNTVRNLFSAGSGIDYDPLTGVISWPGTGVMTTLNGLNAAIQTFSTTGDISISSVGTEHSFAVPYRIDSLKRSNDSVYALKNGSWLFQFIDSAGGAGSETDPTVNTIIKNIPVSADASTNKYLNWNGSAYIRKQIDYSDIGGTPTTPTLQQVTTAGATSTLSITSPGFLVRHTATSLDVAQLTYSAGGTEAGGLLRLKNFSSSLTPWFNLRVRNLTAERYVDVPDATGTMALQEWVSAQGYLATESDPNALLKASNLSDLTNAATARTNLGATTVGANLFTATNPTAVRWIRVNADNTVSFRSAAETISDLGALTSVPTLTDVLTAGNTATGNGASATFWTVLAPSGGGSRGGLNTTDIGGTRVGVLNLNYGGTNFVQIRPATLTGSYTASLPDKGSVNQTFAMLSDIPSTSGFVTNPMTTAGDLILGGASGTPTRLAMGSNGYVLGISGGNVGWINGTSWSGLYAASAVQSGTLTISNTNTFLQIFNGSTPATWTLPDRTASASRSLHIKNAGTANLTIQRAGTDQIFTNAAVNSFTLTPGQSVQLTSVNSYWTALFDGYGASGSSLTDGDKGDITVSSSGTSWTIDNSAVTLAKMANIADATLLGNNTGASAAPVALSGSQATALLNVFTTTLKGLVPAPGSSTGLFLKDDGTWASPTGSGTVNSGTAGRIAFYASTGPAVSNTNANLVWDDTNSELKIGGGSDFGDYKLQVTGNIYTSTGRIQGAGTDNIAYITITQATGTKLFYNTSVATLGNGTYSIDLSSSQKLFIDGTKLATDDEVWIGKNSTGTDRGSFKLQVEGDVWGGGSLTMAEITAPSTPAAGYGAFYVSSTDSKPHFITDGGVDYDLTATGSGSGTVTSVSVVSANGFAGSVATATTTPAITLSTTVTGLLKGNGTAISAATPGVDYAAADNDLAQIASFPSGSWGILTRGVDDTWSLDQTTYITATGAATLTNKTIAFGSNTVSGTLAQFNTAVTDADLVSLAGSETLTNKRVTKRVGTTASSATPTPNADSHDVYTVTALAATATFGAPTGTPTEGQSLIIRVKDNGTARSLSWNAVYRSGTDVTLPTTTVVNKTLYIGFIYNSTDSKWDCVAVSDGY